MTKPDRHILLLGFVPGIGDSLFEGLILQEWKRRHPEGKVTVFCEKNSRELFECLPYVTKVIPYYHNPRMKPLQQRIFGISKTWRAYLQRRWDLVIDESPPNSFRLSRWILPRLFWKDYLSWDYGIFHNWFSMSRKKPPIPLRIANVQKAFGLARPPKLELFPSVDHRATARRLIPKGSKVLALAPFSSYHQKEWPWVYFRDLALRIVSDQGFLPGARIAIFGGFRDFAPARLLADSLPRHRVIDLTGITTVMTSYACLQRCHFFIGNDSAPMHMAAAADIPTLGIFQSYCEDFWAPWCEHGATISGPTDGNTSLLLSAGHSIPMPHPTLEDVERSARRLAKEAGIIPGKKPIGG